MAEVEGLDALLENFMRLIEIGLGEPVTKAALAGGEVIRDAAEQNAPGPHVVAQAIQIEPGFAAVGIGPDKAHWYYGLFETGVQAHVISVNTKMAIFGSSMAHPVFVANHPGIPARPFLRPAFDSSKAAVLDVVGRSFWVDIQKAIV